ncbi:hypothetical protein [Streptomyces sp. NPDC047725]|uniref:hypothetical protein n=1 Tax=Streptomyces sp. NPDC047725 TaxID=3365487 RepID=UPI0037175BB5
MISRRARLSMAVPAPAVSSLPSVAAHPSGGGRSVQRDADALRDAGGTGVAARQEEELREPVVKALCRPMGR